MIEKFHQTKTLDEKLSGKEIISTDFGPENTHYDIAPTLTLEEKKADVSYMREGVLFERTANIYRDQNGNAWFEITKSPRKQMMISLLSQPFFNVATVVEIPEKEIEVSRFFSKINTKLASIFKKSPTFISKGMNLENVEPKTRSQMIANYIVFESIFDRGNGDRDFSKKHNIHYRGSGYALFDFDLSGITPLKHFAESKTPQGYMNRIPDDGMKDYMLRIKDIISGGSGRNPYWMETIVPIEVIEETVKKLKEINEFYSAEDSEQFMHAVLDKTKYAEEYKKSHASEVKGGTLDESYINSTELTKGLLAQVAYSSNVLLNELRKEKDTYLEKQRSKEESLQKYNVMILELEKIIYDSLHLINI